GSSGTPLQTSRPCGRWVIGGFSGATNSQGDSNERVSGGYAGAGVGVDLGRHASLSVLYTNYVYANDYYYSDEDITINRAEVLNVGAEVRF
ncbi:hypothetical protein ABQF20_21705, partial [Xanthomonas campestris pv. campestris]|nr:hypothetical protein [Xanthomonas campestris pv. campestris]MEB2068330.1 hypothetical protein [Xanthomonas campestris pv. campestris]